MTTLRCRMFQPCQREETHANGDAAPREEESPI